MTAEDTGTMTISTISTMSEWPAHPLGKAVRIALAFFGLAMASLVLLLALSGTNSAWAMVLLGVALAVTSVRAAVNPSLTRLSILALTMLAAVTGGQII